MNHNYQKHTEVTSKRYATYLRRPICVAKIALDKKSKRSFLVPLSSNEFYQKNFNLLFHKDIFSCNKKNLELKQTY